MRLSDLQTKDIVSVKSGKRIGRIIDVEIDEKGNIIYFVVEQKRQFRSLVSGVDSTIKFSQIVTIGEDVILVDF